MRLALLALFCGCTIIGAGAGAATGEVTGDGVGHDAKIGALIGAGFDLAVIIYMVAVGSTQPSGPN